MLHVFDSVIGPAAERFRPNLILVSAGFDAHYRDPFQGLQLRWETAGFSWAWCMYQQPEKSPFNSSEYRCCISNADRDLHYIALTHRTLPQVQHLLQAGAAAAGAGRAAVRWPPGFPAGGRLPH